MKGKFIVFEGGEGSGKDTQIDLLKNRFSNRDDVIFTREPGGTKIGEKIRELLLSNESKDMTAMTELLLFSGARAQLMEDVIIPALSNSKNIISNRFALGNLAYQIYGREKPELREFLLKITKEIIGDYNPIYILMDIDPLVGLERVNKRNDKNTRFDNEKLDFHNRVRAGFLEEIMEYENYYIVDASQSIKQIEGNVWDIVNPLLSM